MFIQAPCDLASARDGIALESAPQDIVVLQGIFKTGSGGINKFLTQV
jgi:hypothetical protein